MTTTRRNFMTTTAAMAGSVALPGYLRAQSATIELSCQYSTPVLFKDLMEKLATEFQAKNPDIRITLRAPEVG
ncbi:twin-arginine translocation signal domain-containing protein, partial [Acinetobacter baumannii]